MQTDPSPQKPSRRRGPVSPALIAFLTFFFLLILFLRHDFWNWSASRPFLFGLLPVGLWWQALVSLLASLLLYLLVRFAWPQHLEEDLTTKNANDAKTEPKP